jgi:hypothetical protein
MPDYQLMVAEVTRNMGDDGFSLESLQVRYARPRQLRFSERCDHTAGTLAANQPVELRCDGVVRFHGLIEDVERVGRTDGERVVYTARGPRAQAAGVFPVNATTGFPIYIWSSATLDQMIAVILADAREPLVAAGAMADADEPVVDVPSASYLPIGGRLAGLSFDEALQVLLGYFDGLRFVVEPDTLLWRIVNVLEAPAHTVTIGSDVVLSNRLTESIAGRFTAVRVTGRAVAGTKIERTALAPAWDTGLQSTWTIDQGFLAGTIAGTPPTTLDDALTPAQRVYRRWSFAAFSQDIIESEPVRLVQKVRTAVGQTGYVEVKMAGPPDWDSKIIFAKYPAPDPAPSEEGARPNWRIPGKANAPLEMALQYTRRVTGEAPGIRRPESGYEGTAHSRYGLERELVINQEDRATLERSQQLLDAHKDVIYEGDLPVAGDVPAWLWNLGVRVNIAGQGRTTGLEHLGAIATGFVHEFADGGRTTIYLTTDRAGFLGK